MKKNHTPSNQALFLVWDAPDHGSSRSRLLSQELGIDGPYYFAPKARRSPASAPARYLIQGVRTLRFLQNKQPGVVFVQSPPSFAVWFVAYYCARSGSRFIIDAHSDAFQRAIWTRPAGLNASLARRSMATLVTDDYFRRLIEARGGKVVVLQDPVSVYPQKNGGVRERFTVTFVNTFASDEPLANVLQAAGQLPDVDFYVTGKRNKAPKQILAMKPANVTFTDYLPIQEYLELLQTSHVVMSLTTRDHTLQCGACEALSLERPIITSDWPLLTEYFYQGAVHVDNSPDGICRGVEVTRAEYARLCQEVADLRRLRREEWVKNINLLANMIRKPAEGSRTPMEVGL